MCLFINDEIQKKTCIEGLLSHLKLLNVVVT